MRHLLYFWTLATVLTGCATLPQELPPHSSKFGFQIIKLESRQIVDMKATRKPSYIERLLKNRRVKQTHFPVVHAHVGETVVNDQTGIMSLATEFLPLEDKVRTVYKDYKIGTLSEVNLKSEKAERVTFDVKIFEQYPDGFETVEINEIKVPKQKVVKKEMETTLLLPVNQWSLIGGGLQTQNNKSISTVYVIKIFPPTRL